MADLQGPLRRTPAERVDLALCTTSLLATRTLLEAVSNAPTELTCLRLVPCASSGLGRVVAPPGVLPLYISPLFLPSAVVPGQSLVVSVTLSDTYPVQDLDSITSALDDIERRLVVSVALISSPPPPQAPLRIVLPASMMSHPGERTLAASFAIPAVPVFSMAWMVALEELSLAGAPLVPLPQTIRIGVSHDRKPVGAAWHAAMAGDVTALLNALLAGGSTEEADGYETCLCIAIKKRRHDAVSALVRAGADVNRFADDATTPLCFAVLLPTTECLTALLEAPGIVVNAGCGGARGTALHAACSTPMTGPGLGLLLATPGIDVESLNSKGETPLHVAASCHASEAVSMLLAAGASPNARARNGETPLHRATTAECVATLLAAPGVDVNVATPLGYTPLHRAVSLATPWDLPRLQALLAAPGLDPNPCDMGWETPLHLAALQGRDWAVRALLDANVGVDVGAVNRAGYTPQRLAEVHGRASTAALLRSHGSRAVAAVGRPSQVKQRAHCCAVQ